jgi:hypothetical protein
MFVPLAADVQSTGTFQNSNGPRITVGILNDNKQSKEIQQVSISYC